MSFEITTNNNLVTLYKTISTRKYHQFEFFNGWTPDFNIKLHGSLRKRASDHSSSVRLRLSILEVAVLFHASGSARTVARGRGEGRRCSGAAHTMGAGAHDDHLAEVYRLRHMSRSLPLPRVPYNISWIVHASVPTPPWCKLRWFKTSTVLCLNDDNRIHKVKTFAYFPLVSHAHKDLDLWIIAMLWENNEWSFVRHYLPYSLSANFSSIRWSICYFSVSFNYVYTNLISV